MTASAARRPQNILFITPHKRLLFHALKPDIRDKAVKITAAGARMERLKDRAGTNMMCPGTPDPARKP
jgi:hypothetical protein